MAEPRAVRVLLERARTTIDRRSLFKGSDSVVVAVSGGPDSLALLHVLHRLAPRYALELHVAHFDHRLRDGSAEDAAFVARIAATLGVPATVRSADSTERPRGLSPEEAARERRYAFLEEVADATGATRIATGHTLDDQAETVLMRVVAGTGIRGLGGIPPKRDRIVRPLIDARRAETEAFCLALRLDPRRDPTNADPAFLRNAIRHELVPALEGGFNVRAVEALARLADLARDDDALLADLASAALTPEMGPDGARFDVARLLDLHPALQRRVVRLAAPLDAEHVERVLALARTGTSGDAIDLPSRLNARVEYDSLLIGRAPSPPVPATPVALLVSDRRRGPTAGGRAWGTRRGSRHPSSFDGRGRGTASVRSGCGTARSWATTSPTRKCLDWNGAGPRSSRPATRSSGWPATASTTGTR
ncbi:MAG: tRNA lysidine(34) synthetase TilS [Actinobacteria bacterium]|nr:MAG: tRNA lysidine(34) synthetase TilS [Actinomycetota bacterium]